MLLRRTFPWPSVQNSVIRLFTVEFKLFEMKGAAFIIWPRVLKKKDNTEVRCVMLQGRDYGELWAVKNVCTLSFDCFSCKYVLTFDDLVAAVGLLNLYLLPCAITSKIVFACCYFIFKVWWSHEALLMFPGYWHWLLVFCWSKLYLDQCLLCYITSWGFGNNGNNDVVVPVHLRIYSSWLLCVLPWLLGLLPSSEDNTQTHYDVNNNVQNSISADFAVMKPKSTINKITITYMHRR